MELCGPWGGSRIRERKKTSLKEGGIEIRESPGPGQRRQTLWASLPYNPLPNVRVIKGINEGVLLDLQSKRLIRTRQLDKDFGREKDKYARSSTGGLRAMPFRSRETGKKGYYGNGQASIIDRGSATLQFSWGR